MLSILCILDIALFLCAVKHDSVSRDALPLLDKMWLLEVCICPEKWTGISRHAAGFSNWLGCGNRAGEHCLTGCGSPARLPGVSANQTELTN